jgi:O-methyltransferase
MNETLKLISQFAYSFPITIQNSFDMAMEVLNNNIEGDFVECGVAGGAQIGAFQYAISIAQKNKKIWAFDSYEGIPLAGEFDTEQAGIGAITHNKFLPIEERLVSSGITCHSVENVKENFAKWNLPIHNIEFVKGWFQNTLPNYEKQIDKISILRLDGDLHESTLVCLQHLYPKVVKNGIVIIDDYALEGCRVAVKQYFESIKKALPEMINVDGNGVHYFKKK